MTRSAILAMALLLPACGVVPVCRLAPVADLPATIDHNRLEVTGRVNGVPTRLVVDTGAERTLLTNATVDALSLPRNPHHISRQIGVGGIVSNADVYADIGLGRVHGAERLAVADIPGVGGVIGGDVLSRYDLELDLPNRRVRLWQAAGCGINDLPWTGQREPIPVEITGAGRVRLPVAVDGQAMLALLDSGASLSLMQSDAATHIDASAATDPADNTYAARGVDGTPITVHQHQFGRLTVGPDQFPGPLIGVAIFQLAAADMLLGVDYLRIRRVWIAYRDRRIYVQPASGAMAVSLP